MVVMLDKLDDGDGGRSVICREFPLCACCVSQHSVERFLKHELKHVEDASALNASDP